MTLGAAAAGARAATGSCGQGIALMQETIAEAALNEIALVIFNMARGQQDYFQATRGGGWGDYRTITFAPKDVVEAVEHTQLLFHLADKYRAPVLLYGDYLIAHTYMSVPSSRATSVPFRPRTGRSTAAAAARAAPGRSGRGPWARCRPLGPARTSTGGRSARSSTRSRRRAALRDAHDDADTMVVASAPPPLRRPRGRGAARRGHPIGSFRPITLWPFPEEALERAAASARVLVYEINAGQMIDDVRLSVPTGPGSHGIGGVSVDSSGMRQGSLLTVASIRDRIRRALDLEASP